MDATAPSSNTNGKASLHGPLTIAKNSREQIRVSLDRFKGHHLANMRVWYSDKNSGEYRPGKQGLAFRVELLPNVLAALESIARQLAEEGGGHG